MYHSSFIPSWLFASFWLLSSSHYEINSLWLLFFPAMFKQRSNNLLYSQWSIPKSYPTFFFSWSKSCFTWICHNEEKKRQSRSFCLIPTLGLLLCWYQCYWSESERALLLVLSSWKIMSIVLKILNNIFQ